MTASRIGLLLALCLACWGCPSSVPQDFTDLPGDTEANSTGDEGDAGSQAPSDPNTSGGTSGIGVEPQPAPDRDDDPDSGSDDPGDDDTGQDAPPPGDDGGQPDDDQDSDGDDDSDGGDDGAGDDSSDDDTTNPLARASFSGSLTCENVQTVSDLTTDPRVSQESRSMAFNAEGLPVEVRVLGYSTAPDVLTGVRRVGDQETLDASTGALQATLAVEVTAAEYRPTGFTLELALNYEGVQGNLTYAGTGTQVIDAGLAGGNLEYRAEVNYSVSLVSGSLVLETTERTTCSGVLPPQ